MIWEIGKVSTMPVARNIIIHLPLCQFPKSPTKTIAERTPSPTFSNFCDLICSSPISQFTNFPHYQSVHSPHSLSVYMGTTLLSYFDNEFPTSHAMTMIHNVHIPFPTFLKPIALIYYILSLKKLSPSHFQLMGW